MSHHEVVDILQVDAGSLQLSVELDVRISFVELLACHAVVVGFRVAQFGRRLGSLGEFGFEFHHVYHLFLSFSFTKANESKHLGYVLLISLTYSFCRWVFVEVVRLLSECHSSLPDVQDILFGVLSVGAIPCSNKLVVSILCVFQLHFEELFLGFGLFELLDKRHERFNPVG